MIERKCGQFIQRMPLRGRSVVSRTSCHFSGFDPCQIGHSHGPTAWIAAGFAAGIQLFELGDLDSGLFAQFAARRVGQSFLLVDETSW